MVMCTLALFFHETEDFPLIVAANRDEFFTRPSAPPQLLSSNPKVLGGKDLLAGGTWLGINEDGMLAGVLNRKLEEKEERADKRSRGLLCLDVLAAGNPPAARALLRQENGDRYRPFNLLFANREEAYVAYNESQRISCRRLNHGLYVFGNHAVYESHSVKASRAYWLFSQLKDRFRKSRTDPLEWIPDLKAVLSDHGPAINSDNPKDAICVHSPSYGTVSSTLIFYRVAGRRFCTFHTDGPPCRAGYGNPLWLEAR